MKNIDILDRCVNYSLGAIELYREIEKNAVGSVIGRQFLRSTTSVGANVNEAQAAQSRADFVHKMQIALKEIKETGYWLKLLEGARVLECERLVKFKKETEEITCILTAIIKNPKKNET